MQTIDWIVSSGLLGIIGLVWKSSNDNDRKVSRVYGRLDEVKKDNDTKFTRKEVCQILHSQIAEKLDDHTVDLKEIKSMVQELRNNGKK